MPNNHWWYQSGEAALAAQSVAWMVVLLCGMVAVAVWIDIRKEQKDVRKNKSPR